MTFPITTRSTGFLITASAWNELVDAINFIWSGAPTVKVYNSANISVPNNTETALTFDTELWDTDGMHDTVSQTERLTCVTAGKYYIHACVEFAAGNTGYRLLSIRLNGSTYLARIKVQAATSSQPTILALSTEADLVAADYVELTAWHTQGSAINAVYAAAYSPNFGMRRLG